MSQKFDDDPGDFREFDSDFDGAYHLTPDQIELLAILGEEAAEIIQVVGKILRFGYDSHCPKPHPLGQEANHQLLINEITDLRIIVDLLWTNGDIDETIDMARVPRKIEKLKKYLKYYKIKDSYDFKNN